MAGATDKVVPKEAMAIPDEEEGDLCFDEYMDEDEDINIVDDGSAQDAETNKFDRIVGCLEDILMDPEFEDARESFCRNNCCHFEDTDENKLVYTEIFGRYTELVESCIEKKLKEAIPGFDMYAFMEMLDTRKDELMSDVFDLLLSLGDFESFKDTMLAYKKESMQDGGSALHIECTPMHIHQEDQEDGEFRPDLDLGLQISPIGAGPAKKY